VILGLREEDEIGKMVEPMADPEDFKSLSHLVE